MFKKIIFYVLALVLVLPFATQAATFKAGQEVNFNQAQATADDLYLAGGNVSATGQVLGDLLAAGGNMLITSSTSKDLMVAGGSINVTGDVGDTLRIAGGNIMVGSKVAGDAVIVGGQVSVLPSSMIEKGLYVAGGRVSIDGTVASTTVVRGGDVTINGQINGDVDIRGNKVVIGDQAVIKGKLTYYSPNQATISNQAKVIGGVDYHPVAAKQINKKEAAAVFGVAALVSLLIKIISLFLSVWLLVLLFGSSIPAKVIDVARTSFWRKLGLGFVVLIIVPIAAVILFITIIGIPLGIITALSYVLVLFVSYLLMIVLLGSYLWKILRHKDVYEINWKSILIGVVAALILAIVPIIGWIISVVLFLVTLGAVSSLTYERLQNVRRV